MLEDASDDVEEIDPDEMSEGDRAMFLAHLVEFQFKPIGGAKRRQLERIEMLNRYFEGEDEEDEADL